VNDSERLAIAHLENELRSEQGDDEWILLANLSFSRRNDRQSDEIDIVAIGPPGVRVVEVKHWDSNWIKRHLNDKVAIEAEKVTRKAKRIGTNLRNRVHEVGRVDGAFLVTARRHARGSGSKGLKVRGIPFFSLNEWKGAVGFALPGRLNPRQVRSLAEELAPEAEIALKGRVDRLCGCTELSLESPADNRFHRIYRGVKRPLNTRIILHVYDLSAGMDNAEVQARREFEALNRLYKQPWTPRVRDSFQEVREYPGEMCFFSVIDPCVPTLAKRSADPDWDLDGRLAFALTSICALKGLHSDSGRAEPILHRNLTPETILVADDDSPILTGFELTRIPSEVTLAPIPIDVGRWGEVIAPEVRERGLSAASRSSDCYSLCASLKVLFRDDSHERSAQAAEALDLGAAQAPDDRCDLEEVEWRISSLRSGTYDNLVCSPPEERQEGREVRFRGRKYKIVACLGSGGLGETFKVEAFGRSSGEFFGCYVGKTIRDREMGRRVLRSYELARPRLGRHRALSAIFEVADDWDENGFVALMTWVEGSSLSERIGELAHASAARQQTSSESVALKWIREICEALEQLHENGLVHGDVSLQNIIVSEGSPVLTDYDLVTKSGETALSPGTPLYCSPSRLEAQPATPSDDVYALAAAFFHLLCGVEPFKGTNAAAKRRGLDWSSTDRNRFPLVASFLDKSTNPNPDMRFRDATDALKGLNLVTASTTGAHGRGPRPAPSHSAVQPLGAAFEPEHWDPEWVAAMSELAAREGVEVEVGADIKDDLQEGVVGQYLAMVTVGGQPAYLVDSESSDAEAVVRTLRHKGLSALKVTHSQPAAEIFRALSTVLGSDPTLVRETEVSAPDRPLRMDYSSARSRLVQWLRDQLIGPTHGAEDSLSGISPLERYPAGVLHPVESAESDLQPRSEQYPDSGSESEPEDPGEGVLADGEGTESQLGRPVRRRRYVPPSSVGFSCFIRGKARLEVTVSFAKYKVGPERSPSGTYSKREYLRSSWEESFVWEEGAPLADWTEMPFGVEVRQRRLANGSILTVSLFNRPESGLGDYRALRTKRVIEGSLFEVHMECRVSSGKLLEYPRVDRELLTEEEREIELQYRGRAIYAVGHGAAVRWSMEGAEGPRIWTDFMPSVEVPRVRTTAREDDRQALDISRLASEPTERLIPDLDGFVEGYAQWIRAQDIDCFTEADRPDALRIRQRMMDAEERMQRGVSLIENDPIVLRAFRIANQAMLSQMQQGDRIRGKRQGEYRWRPFQLAFLLSVIESTVSEEDSYRQILDLIWFPTGGGKTEAYLGLIAFLTAWRRLSYGQNGAGTVALMRYTLRLLTSQQFERAARIVFALELIRRRCPDQLGTEPISVGIWVGSATSPNRFREALDCAQRMQEGEAPPSGLVLDACPWCGTAFGAENYSVTASSFSFKCADLRCEFGRSGGALPCNVVDEALYESPPSLLIGTIDKFARLAWESRAASFFGNGSLRPPELVIQDELHLISGPLGSVAGLYEAGLETLLQARGVRPKYIASTATIRMAESQVRRLYGRPVRVFPPPGLSCDDSYFASADHDSPGRLYVGFLAPMLDRNHALAPLAGALLAAPESVFSKDADREELMEAWWTQVVYHTSLTDVGTSHTAYSLGIRDWEARISDERAQATRGTADSVEDASQRIADAEPKTRSEIRQLTSRQSAGENAVTFARLGKHRGTDGCLDVLLATNMVSVGLDVDRLAVMIVNGQPLTTAEYIQASSRVGRSDVPGIVVANYHRSQASSLFHYENFQSYHESFYRFVEAASVTPFTYQVRSRALHGALVTAIRHGCPDLRGNEDAGEFDPDSDEVRLVIELLKQRCAEAQAGGDQKTADHIDRLVSEWFEKAQRCKRSERGLKYDAGSDGGQDSLLISFDSKIRGPWMTLHSMRDVERTAALRATR